MKHVALVWTVVAGAAVFAATVRPTFVSADSTATKHLIVSASAATAPVAPGARVSLVLNVSPKPAMHVYAPGQKDFIPVSLTLERSDAFTAGTVQFPPAETVVVKELGETQRVYRKPFRIVQNVTLAGRASASRGGPRHSALTVTGTLKYQACDDSICYAPVSVPVKWTLALQDGPAAPKQP
jgi:Disulphide bond corrector protein DsbC